MASRGFEMCVECLQMEICAAVKCTLARNYSINGAGLTFRANWRSTGLLSREEEDEVEED